MLIARLTRRNGSAVAGTSSGDLADGVGTARRPADGTGTATDAYSLDAFGRGATAWGTTPDPYRYGGAWGYMTDPSGLLQLGARFYWPELGRFIQQDPIGDGMNWYAYVGNNPVVWVDPTGWWGGGVGVSGSAEAGGVAGGPGPGGPIGGAAGIGVSGATGTGVFWGGPKGVTGGAWADAGGFAGTGTRGLAFPRTRAPHAVAGAYAGIGAIGWLTNANSVNELAGPFHNININAGIGPIRGSLQIAWSNGIVVVSIGPPGLGLGAGASISSYDTCAVVVP